MLLSMFNFRGALTSSVTLAVIDSDAAGQISWEKVGIVTLLVAALIYQARKDDAARKELLSMHTKLEEIIKLNAEAAQKVADVLEHFQASNHQTKPPISGT